MAMEGTHIKFALEIKDKLNVKNLDKYISGTIYPDSRYFTGIDRNLTHNEEFLNKKFYGDNDFKKGWVVHLICDKVQFMVFNNIFNDILDKFKNEKKLSMDNWVLRTSLKIVQDIYDVSQFGIKKYLNHLEYTENPNNENLTDMKEYNQIWIDQYKKEVLKIENETNGWEKLKIDSHLVENILIKSKELSSDKMIMDRIKLIYPKMIIYSEEFLIDLLK
jgi:hypothetical protein